MGCCNPGWGGGGVPAGTELAGATFVQTTDLPFQAGSPALASFDTTMQPDSTGLITLLAPDTVELATNGVFSLSVSFTTQNRRGFRLEQTILHNGVALPNIMGQMREGTTQAGVDWYNVAYTINAIALTAGSLQLLFTEFVVEAGPTPVIKPPIIFSLRSNRV